MISDNLPYFVVAFLVLAGFVDLVLERNMIKIAIAIDVIESAANLFLIVLGYKDGGYVPIKYLASPNAQSAGYVLPVPQALTLTAIVIGLATSALMLSFIVMLYRHYGTLDIHEIRRLRG